MTTEIALINALVCSNIISIVLMSMYAHQRMKLEKAVELLKLYEPILRKFLE